MNPKYVEMTIGFDMQLGHLIEECGEATQVAGKILRWGAQSRNPTIPNSLPNWQILLNEMADLKLAIDRLEATIKSEFKP